MALLFGFKDTFVVGVFLPVASPVGLTVLLPFRDVFRDVFESKNSGLFVRVERGVDGSDTEPPLDSLIRLHRPRPLSGLCAREPGKELMASAGVTSFVSEVSQTLTGINEGVSSVLSFSWFADNSK